MPMPETQSRNLRSSTTVTLLVPRSRTFCFDKSFTCTSSAPKLWNWLPISVRISSSINDFKEKLKYAVNKITDLFYPLCRTKPGPEVIKLFSCSTQLSMKIFLLINVKMPTNVGILTFMGGKNSILGLFEPKKS